MATLLFTEGENAPVPIHRKQLLCHIVDGMAKARPEALYAEFPYSPLSYEDGFRKITYAAFANAINGLALWLYKTLGPGNGNDFPTIAYIGPNDIRYNALILAAVKTGYKVLLTSPRNSLAAHSSLFTLLDCSVMVVPNPYPPGVSAIVESSKLRAIEIPSVENLLSERFPHFQYNKTFHQARMEPLVVLHTSGTTGLPKPIIWTHGFAASVQDWISLEDPSGFTSQKGLWTSVRLFNTLPPFHAGGLYATFLTALFNQTSMIYPLSGVLLTAQVVADGIKHTKADCVALAPPLVEEVSRNPDLLEFFATKVDSIVFAGGNVPKDAGDKISSRMKFSTMLGITEAGIIPTIRSSDFWPTETWNYLQFHPNAGLEFRHHSEDQYEAVIIRDKDSEKVQPVFHIFPSLQEWSTKDLYSPHPTIPKLWNYRGRADDIIVFLTGEKTNPVSMEQHVSSHPEVRSALVIGTQKFQAGLLIELNINHSTTTDRAQIIERLWPTIKEANQDCPRHAKVAKSHILFTQPNKPMERAGKGTVQRQPTMKLYAKEIDALYSDAEKLLALDPTETSASQQSVDISDSASIESFVHDQVVSLIGESSTILNDDNFFIQGGMDSLQVLQLTRSLKQTLKIPDLSVSTIYTNPSISSLAKAISYLSEDHEATNTSSAESRQQVIESVLGEFKELIDKISTPPSRSRPLPKERVVILTGSTGAIGSHILDILLQSSGNVSRIYCLNRSSNSELIQLDKSKARHLQTNFTDRVTFLTADLAKEHFGLESNTYMEIFSSVTDIIHNAWPVNFNLPLSAFKPSLLGVVNIVTLAATASQSPSVTFLSSISAITSYHPPIPEAIISNPLASLPMGYGESKYLAEHILDYAGRKIPAITIARVGQVAGPAKTSGLWNKQEWVPSLVLSSLHLGMIPESLGPESDTKVDWVPIDLLAASIVELAFNKEPTDTEQQKGATVFHPMNPTLTSWSSIAKVMTATLSDTTKKEVISVPFTEWLQRLRSEAAANTGSLEDTLKVNPAIKLLPFYESLAKGGEWPTVDTAHALKGSKQLQQLEGVGILPEWVESWVKGWVQN